MQEGTPLHSIAPGGDPVTNAYRQVHLLYLEWTLSCITTITGHKCLSASTFTVLMNDQEPQQNGISHKCLSASTFTVPIPMLDYNTIANGSQMPIGKYIYCTE